MRILIDISHPAHVHFFKNAIWKFEERGHTLALASREKDITLDLLDALGFTHSPLSVAPPGNSLFAFSSEMLIHCARLYRLARRFRPDVMLQIAGTFIAPVSQLIGRPAIGFYDTEFARVSNAISYPLLAFICTPRCYKGEIGKNHVRYDGYHELAYLHPNKFNPDRDELHRHGLRETDKFFIVRFVGWHAMHDRRENGFSVESKRRLIRSLSASGRVFVTSESALPAELEQFRSQVPAHRLHHLMAYASLVVGESATMASEAAVLGVPAIFVATTGRGYTDEQEHRYGLVRNFTPDQQNECLDYARALAQTPISEIRSRFGEKRRTLLRDCVDTTDWLVDFVENHV
jgi:predicted glycosyltransferase